MNVTNLKRNTIIAVALILGVVAASTSHAAKAETFQESFEKTYPIESTARFSFEGVSDDLVVKVWDEKKIEIKATFSGKGKAPEVKIDPDTSDFEIEVDHSGTRRKSQSVKVVVRLPEGVKADINNVSGDLSLEGVKGGIQINLVSGDVTVSEIGEKLEVNTVSGDLHVEKADVKRFDLNTVSGKVICNGLKAKEVSLKAVSGDFRCEKSRCENITMNAVSGDVFYEGALVEGGTYEFSTKSGDVTLSIPAETSFRIDLSTFSGDLTCDFPLDKIKRTNGESLSGVHKDGKAEIEVSTFSGEVIIKKK